MPEDHIEKYDPGTGRLRDGTVNVASATQMLRHYISVYPQATHVTMSWLDGHTDHGSAGQALRLLVTQHALPADQALFSMARWYWAYDYPNRSDGLSRLANQLRARRGYPLATSMLHCDDDECRDRIRAAVNAYKSPTDIGYRSVQTYLDVVEGDPEILLHGVEAGRYDARLQPTRSVRTTATGPTAAITGAGVVTSFGTYPAPLESPDLLASTLVGPKVAVPFDPGTGVTVRAYDAAHRQVGYVRTTTTASGRFTATLPVPASASTLTAVTDQTQGLTSAVGGWKVQRSVVRYAPLSRGVTVVRGTLRGGYGQSFLVNVRTTTAGRAASGVLAVLRPQGGRGWRPAKVTAKSDSAGAGVLHGVLGGAQTWYAGTEPTDPAVLPPIGTAIRTKVSPALLGVYPEASAVRRNSHHAAVIRGRVGGHSYGIPRDYLVPARVRIWLKPHHGRAHLLRVVTTAPGGAFHTTVASRRPGVVRFEVMGRPGTYRHLARAGRLSLL